jgi:hypothetical protein
MRRSPSSIGRTAVRALSRAAIALTLLGAPTLAHADGATIRDILIGILNDAAPIWVPVAVLIVVIAGFTMLVTTSEDGLNKGRNTVTAVVIGGIIIVLGPVLLALMYQAPGTQVANVGPQLNAEALGIVGWLCAMGGVFGIFMIVVAAVRAVSGFGGDEGAYANVRNAVLNAVIGLIIMASAIIIHDTVFSGTPNPLVQLILDKVLIILAIITTIAVAILVYAGFRMVTNFGNEENFSQAKSLVFRVIAGLAVILVSYVLVIFVANAFS